MFTKFLGNREKPFDIFAVRWITRVTSLRAIIVGSPAKCFQGYNTNSVGRQEKMQLCRSQSLIRQRSSGCWGRSDRVGLRLLDKKRWCLMRRTVGRVNERL